MYAFVMGAGRYILAVIAVIILGLCLAALLGRKSRKPMNVGIYNPETDETYPVVSREASIGRHKNCDIILNYPAVSRFHAVISCGRDGWYLKPLGNDSRTLVNGAEVEKTALLPDGSKITFGNVNVYFVNKEK